MHTNTLLRSHLRRNFSGQALRTALFLSCAWLFAAPIGFAQSGDDCSDATPIADPSSFCSATEEGNNLFATPSNEPTPACFSGADTDVWFCFTAVGSELVLVINAINTSLFEPSIALYSGSCTSGLTELGCETATAFVDVVELRQSGLTPGAKYYFRVDGFFPGTFQYCIRNYFGTDKIASDCPIAVRLCDKSTFNVQSVTGPGADPTEFDEAPCFLGAPSGEINSTWYTFTAATDGTLTFTLTPNNPEDDLDFIVYSLPNGPGDCTDKVVERCMNAGDFFASSPCMGPTGLNLTADDIDNPPGCAGITDNFLKYLDMTAGTTYALAVNNFTSSGNGFQVEWGGTAQFLGPKVGFQTDEADSNICIGEEILMTDTSSFAPSLGTLTGWHWNFGDGAVTDTANTRGPHSVQYKTQGIKTVSLTVTTSTGCEVTVTRQVEVEFCCAIQAEVVVSPGCPGTPGATASVTEQGGIQPLKYAWSNGQQDSVATGLQSGNYTVMVEDAAGCRDTVNFAVNTPLNVSVTLPKDTTIVKGTKANLLVASPNAGLTVIWMSGNDTLSGNTLSVMPEKTTTYLVAASVGNCVFSDSVTVEVIEELLQMPNAFTPNGDDVNDLLRPAMLGYTLLQLEVWARWGEKVYDSTLDNQNKGWNGIFNDKPAPADVYFYRVLVRRTADGTTVARNSNVTLLR